MSDYPWQPSPWEIGEHGVIDATGKTVYRDPSGPNVAIEAMAAEMAEFILSANVQMCDVETGRKLDELVSKLAGLVEKYDNE